MSDAPPEVFRHDGFGRKVGPLPIWGWAIVLAAVVFIYVRFLHGGGRSSSAAGSASQAYPNVMSTGGYLPASSGSGSVSVGATPPMYTDNTAWENAAIQGASQYGGTPLSVQQAVDQYMKGSQGSIDPTQESMINRIIAAIGAPPIPSVNGGTPSIIDPGTVTAATPGNLLSFIRSPNGSIAALFDNGTISEYGNMNQFNTAKNAAGSVPFVPVTAAQYGGYKKTAPGYTP